MQSAFVLFIFCVIANAASTFAADTLDISVNQPGLNVSRMLYGIFFEEINHAGQGGLYAELVWNSQFGDEDYAPWFALDSSTTYLRLNNEHPLNYNNVQSLEIRVNGAKAGQMVGIVNPGFHGINLLPGAIYDASFYFLGGVSSFRVQLESADGSVVYASSTISTSPATGWKKVSTSLTVGSQFAADGSGRVSIAFAASSSSLASVFVDVVSVMPRDTYRSGLPIRKDLGNMIEQLQPAFIRFPGGCFVEGDRLADRFNWKKAIGPREQRPGHFNLWGYFDEDGLGFYEFMVFIEELSSRIGQTVEPVWVVNNGVSHTQSIPVSDIQPWIEDALDSLEFAMGSVNTKYGAIRAQMGHPQPFTIKYVAIGNEDCGKPWYNENYNAFYKAFQAKYPSITLIANCDMTSANLPTQLWDYHVYQSTNWFFSNDHYWDSQDRKKVPFVFNSEYAVTTDAGLGNLKAGVAEAAWMTGLERNSDLVTLASYAPMFVHTNDRTWNPDAIVFDSHSAYGTPSYWVQKLFMNAAYTWAVNNTLRVGQPQLLPVKSSNSNLAIVATIAPLRSAAVDELRDEMESDVATDKFDDAASPSSLIVLKIVNKATSSSSSLSVSLNGLSSGASVSPSVDVAQLTGTSGTQENTFDNPTAIVPVISTLAVKSNQFTLNIPAFSVNIYKIYVSA